MREGREPLDDLPEPPPGRDLAVPPTRVGSPRTSRSALAALLGVAGVILLASVLAQLPGAPVPEGPPVARVTSVPARAAARDRATPSPTAAPAASPNAALIPLARSLPPRLSREDLRDRVVDGSADGQLVFVDGVLEVTPVRCQSLAQSRSRCVDLSIPGIGLPVWAGASALPWRGDPPPGAWLVTVARAGGLVYLGSLLPEPDVPAAIGTLTRRLLAAELADPPGTLFQVDSWLVPAPSTTCYRPGVPATPCPTRAPFLAADRPQPDGTLRSERGAAVALASPPVDVDAGDRVVGGRFLVTLPPPCDPADAAATCDPSPRWLVVARYDPSRSIRVLVP
jgi:hypothetical protein